MEVQQIVDTAQWDGPATLSPTWRPVKPHFDLKSTAELRKHSHGFNHINTHVIETLYTEDPDKVRGYVTIVIRILQSRGLRVQIKRWLLRVHSAATLKRCYRAHLLRRRIHILQMMRVWTTKEHDPRNFNGPKHGVHLVSGDYIPIWQAVGRVITKSSKLKICFELYAIHQVCLAGEELSLGSGMLPFFFHCPTAPPREHKDIGSQFIHSPSPMSTECFVQRTLPLGPYFLGTHVIRYRVWVQS